MMRWLSRANRWLPALIVLGASALGGIIAGPHSWQTSSARAAGEADISQLPGQIVAMRRLTESQYRNSIADIFGPDIVIAGRFEPIVRPQHQLIASGAASTTISPAGLEQFDAMARAIAGQVFDAAHQASFLACTPQQPAAMDTACARDTLAPIGRYLFRRPLEEAELQGYVAMAGIAARQSGSFTKGLELALAAMLVAPEFLYVIETAEIDPDQPGTMRLDNQARATRLSFLLWNTTPSDALLDAAAAGKLTDPAQYDAITQAMVQSPRFEQGLRAFFADMLLFEKFDEIAKDPLVYPRFNTAVARALPEQMLRTITDHLIARDGDYRDLFTTRRSFMTRSLGPVYQMPVRSASGWEPVSFAADDPRAGLLGQAGFLALYSHSGRSSPTLRGRAVRELLLCQPVPNPPGNVNFTAVQDINSKTMPTARDRLTAHNSDPVCSGCHLITDPIGLTLEKFDGIGAFRPTENAAMIDTAADLDSGAVEGAAGLGQSLALDPSATQCVASRAVEFATGRSAEGNPALDDALLARFTDSGFRIRALFHAIAISPAANRIPSAPTGGAHAAISTNPRSGARR